MRYINHLKGNGPTSGNGFTASLCGCWWGLDVEFADHLTRTVGRACKSCTMLRPTTPVGLDHCRVCGRQIQLMCYRHTGICSGLCESAEKKAEMQKTEGK